MNAIMKLFEEPHIVSVYESLHHVGNRNNVTRLCCHCVDINKLINWSSDIVPRIWILRISLWIFLV